MVALEQIPRLTFKLEASSFSKRRLRVWLVAVKMDPVGSQPPCTEVSGP